MLRKLRQAGTSFFWELCKRPFSRCMVLAYHSINEPLFNPWGNALTKTYFAEQLEMLFHNYEVVDLATIVHCYREGETPAKSVALSFDDGYADNLHTALPLLEKYELPATFFLTTGYMNQKREFWWDELERIVLHPASLPKQLTLEIGLQTYRWELSPSIRQSPQDVNVSKNQLAAEAKENTRFGFCYSLWQKLIQVDCLSRDNALEQIAQWAGIKREVRVDFRMLTRKEVATLAQHPLVTIGGHTHLHPSLPTLSRTAQKQEIMQNRKILLDILGEEPTLFSYPYGDCTSQTKDIVREVGYQNAFRIEPGTVWRYMAPFKIPRLAVRNCSGSSLQQQMRLWF